ncbi:hypothetical protein EDD21DRAFT_422126 [Dissophora ornata]|nr:hypothetical protein EDD21DRAFT_422126 [Dissophora ornata]
MPYFKASSKFFWTNRVIVYLSFVLSLTDQQKSREGRFGLANIFTLQKAMTNASEQTRVVMELKNATLEGLWKRASSRKPTHISLRVKVDGHQPPWDLSWKLDCSNCRNTCASCARIDIGLDDLQTASAHQGSSFKELDSMSNPSARFPAVATKNPYVRQGYKDFYDGVSKGCMNDPTSPGLKRLILTGTSGIGKSAFLAYFTIRILATSSEGNPPIVIFQDKSSIDCFAYGGTIISASPETLYSKVDQYREVDKRVSWHYHIAPWTLEELMQCRNLIHNFHTVPEDIVTELYSKIGGVPRYVLEAPMGILQRDPKGLDDARKKAHGRVQKAIFNIKDPMETM